MTDTSLDSTNPSPITAEAVKRRVQELYLPIDIALLSCNRARLTEISIRAIKERTTTPHRLVVLDNGSADRSPQMLRKLYDEGLIDRLGFLDENTGVHWGHNTLLDMVESEPHYVSCDNDLVPSVPVDGRDWLARLLDLMARNPEYAAIACRPHILIGEPSDRFDDCGEIRDMSWVGAHLRLMRVDLVREVGGWQKQKRPSRNHEEKWICGRLRKAGYKVGYSRDVRCIHLWGDEEFDEDPWGYPLALAKKPQDHGHREVWPPPNRYNWYRIGIDWKTCMPGESK